MNIIKNLFSGILGFAILIGIIIISGIVLVFGIKIVSVIYPILLTVNTIATFICIFILLPLAIFKKTRIISVYGLLISSYIFGACLWTFSFLMTYYYWGLLGVIFGVVLLGVGVVPVAFIASLFHADWSTISNIIYVLILSWGARSLSIYFAKKIDEEEARKNLYSEAIHAEDIIEATEIESEFTTEGKECDKCNTLNNKGAKFCRKCGNKFKQ